MKLNSTWKKSPLNMHSRLKTLSIEVEAEETEGEIIEEEAEEIRIQKKDTQRSNINSVKTHKIKDEEGEQG
jgi:hypothetical protein